MLRFTDFDVFYERIVLELDNYINHANVENLDGWQVAAQQFKHQLAQQLQASHSLVDLKHALITFCETLRSPFNKLLSTVVGPFWSKNVGEAIGAPGSRLQKTLTTIAAGIAPFAAVYILDEIKIAKQKPILTASSSSSYVSFNFHSCDHEYLSAEGLRVLALIVNDETLADAFLRQSKHYISETEARNLLQSFVKEYKSHRCGI